MAGRRGAPERFLTTVLMTDIVASTEHAAELGDSGWRELVQSHHGLVRAALRRHGGREIDTAGDGFFATFDAPAAAVRCALEIVERVRELGIDIRAGVHVGEVEQVGGKVAGITVPIASRIMAMAPPGVVLVSATVRDLATGSGLRFEDRGEHDLKGVPGTWRIFEVQRVETEEGITEPAAGARERRTAAVRRARARPIWQRRPRLVAAAVIGLAIVLAGSGLLIWKPWQPQALAGVAENSIGIIDPARGELIGQIRVGTQPSGIAVGEGFAWVTNSADDEVSQIDLAARSVVNRIPVGREPTGIAVSGGAVWVTNSGGRTISRINAATRRVVQEIEVGNAPRVIVPVGNALWVANFTDSTLVRIDPASGATGAPVGVGSGPVALAADETQLWVASEDLASVSRVDPMTGSTIAVVPLGVRPSALALGADGLWVASSEGTLTLIDRQANRVTVTVPIGSTLASIALTDDAVWVGDRVGTVYRVERGNPMSPARRIATTAAVHALAVVEQHGVWLATQGSPESHRGGSLRAFWIDQLTHATDPLGDPFSPVSSLQGDGLLGHRRAGGAVGAALLPNLATSISVPGDGGLTYSFSLRAGLVYSTGEPVAPSDFRRAIERSYLVPSSFIGTIWGAILFSPILGAEACMPTFDEEAEVEIPVERCDLSAGIVADDSAQTVTFKLAEPDPDFLYKLATPIAFPVPQSVPMDALVEGTFPATGPYVVASTTDAEISLVRNEHFSVWDAAVRPDGFTDEIVLLGIDCPFGGCSTEASDAAIATVENGEADLAPLGRPARPSDGLLARLVVQYPDRWHFGSARTIFVVMNDDMPPFDNIDVRRAVNFAFDRTSPRPQAVATCQLLPPGWPGYEPYCPYTISPDEGGRWRSPDLERARELIAASGTAGMPVTVGPVLPFFGDALDDLASVLGELGYDVTVDRNPQPDFPELAAAQVSLNGWSADYLSSANFLQLFLCPETTGGEDADGIILYCDPTREFDAAFERAHELQATDRAAANTAWAALDRWAVDQAILAPFANPGADFVSDRVGNYQFSPTGFPLYDQMWVQ